MIRNVYKLYHVVNFFFKYRFVNAYIYCVEIAVQVSDVAYETLVYVNSVDIPCEQTRSWMLKPMTNVFIST